MTKKAVSLLLTMILFAAPVFCAFYKKSVNIKDEPFFLYTNEAGVEITREKILKDGKTQFAAGVQISGEVKELDAEGNLLFLWTYKDNKLHGSAFKFYPTGEKLYELIYENDVLSGPSKKFYEDGTIAEQVVYIDGKVEGTAKTYLKNGNYYKYSYKDNKLNGISYLYDKNNRLLESSTYKNNILEGSTKKYYLSGALKSEMEYVKGNIEGYVRYFDEKGHEINTLLYKDGKEISNMRDERVSQKTASKQKQGEQAVVWQGPAQMHMAESDKMLNEIRFFAKSKNLNGKHSANYRNGQIHYEGSFVNNMPHGIFKTYSLDGKLVAVDNYSNGKLNGKSEMYYVSGEKFAEFRYDKGKLEGKSGVYKKDGSLITEVRYRNGLMHGTLEVFYETGDLCFEAYFSDGIPVGQLRYYFPEDKKLNYLIDFQKGKISKSIKYSIDGFVEFEAAYDN